MSAPEVRVRRYTFLERLLFVVIALGVIVAISGSMIALARQETLVTASVRLECVTRLTADFQAAVGDTLKAPPAPNDARLTAVARIEEASRRLHHVDRFCP